MVPTPEGESSELDVSMRMVRQAALSKLFGEPAAPVRLGHFTILERIGSGAMGTVYSAYDTRLDRKVAIKLLHEDAGDRERLLREAQSLARLSHPNVVAIFEVGTWEHRLFMVMEFVDGVTLAEWTKQGRTWREVRDVLVEAGRGLAAAHGVGLVHRDFKPANVLIDARGRVRVADFGLARASQEMGSNEPTLEDDADASGANQVTTSGMLGGTPAYMSPEMFEGLPATARSDQFAFCVVLYEALVGTRPFAGQTVPEIARSVLGGAFAGWPRDCKVPSFLRRVVERGLCSAPQERFDSMDALVDHLGRDPARRVGVWGLGLAIATTSAGVTWSAVGAKDACAVDREPIASAWEEQKSPLLARFADAPGGASTWGRVENELDAYTDAWLAARKDACEAAREGRDPELLLVRRNACLDRRLEEMSALIRTFAQPGPEVVRNAVSAAVGLVPVSTCGDAELLLAEPDLPSDPEAQRAIADIRLRVSEARALQALGKHDAGLAVAERAHASAIEIEYPPVQAETGLQLGALLCWRGRTADAERLLHEVALSGLSHGLPLIAADAWNYLVWALAYPDPRYREAHAAADYAQALLEGRKGQERRLGTLRARRGRLFLMEGKLDEALAEQEAAFELRQSALGAEDPDIPFSLLELGKVYKARGEWEEARERFAEAAELFGRAIGPEHPQIAEALGEVANILVLQGKHEAAAKTFREALALAEAALGAEHDSVASLWSDYALALIRLRRHEEAWDALQRAEDIWTAHYGADGHPVVFALLGKAEVRQVQEAFAEAEALYRRALAIVETREGKSARRYGTTLGKLGHLMIAQSRWRDAADYFVPALETSAALLGPDHPERAGDLVGLAVAMSALGQASEAVRHAEAALELGRQREIDARLMSDARRIVERGG